MIDFDDLLRLCRRDLREDRDFAQAQHWRYQHLFVDEFQDVNPLQRSLLDAWMGGRSDLCVVGDPNQAIYGWNGADPTALSDFGDEHPGAEIVHLTDNYRSSPQILAVANAVLAGGALDGESPRAAIEGALRANRRDGPIPTVTAYPDDTSRGPRHRPRPARPPPTRRVVVDPGGAVSHQRPGRRDRTGAARLVDPVPGPGRRRPARPTRDQGGPARPATPPGRPVRRAGRPGRGHRGRAERRGARPAGRRRSGPGRRRRRPGRRRRCRRPAANLEALARLGHDYLAVESRPTTAGFVAWLGETTRSDQPDRAGRRRRAGHLPRGQGPRVAGGAPGRASSRASCRSATPGSDDDLAEERRLFYVALTRAEHEVHCTWAETRTFGERGRRRARARPTSTRSSRRRGPCRPARCPPTGWPTSPRSGRRCRPRRRPPGAPSAAAARGAGAPARGSTRPISTDRRRPPSRRSRRGAPVRPRRPPSPPT